MNIKSWEKCTSPIAMLQYLGPRGRKDQYRMFSLACGLDVPMHSANYAVDQMNAMTAAEGALLLAQNRTPVFKRQQAIKMERRRQSDLIRDIFGNPFHPITIAPAWLTWNDGVIVKLAQAIYEERELPSGHLDAGRLAILADALEDAGCTNADILGHCRSPGPHVRGCWVVDLILLKDR